ncbi:hypothetical protein [uncultured Jannaschia sp.]|uniref:hypothetical protein n=1 Tax=uncultured Jannaschia sp. TaxID=293347 RepID=UPI0026355922|nr:hypothetical protein [uncultured Jannaschia sp.]
MLPANLTFEYALGKEARRSYFDRSDILIRSLPEIEKRYVEMNREDFSGLSDIPEETRNEALDIYNKVVEDGRYVRLLADAPKEAIERLGLRVSDDALSAVDRIRTQLVDPGTVEGPVEAVIAVAVVIAVAAGAPQEGFVLDQSAGVRRKL